MFKSNSFYCCRLQLSLWQAEISTAKDSTDSLAVYMFTETPPFEHVRRSDPGLCYILLQINVLFPQYICTRRTDTTGDIRNSALRRSTPWAFIRNKFAIHYHYRDYNFFIWKPIKHLGVVTEIPGMVQLCVLCCVCWHINFQMLADFF